MLSMSDVMNYEPEVQGDRGHSGPGFATATITCVAIALIAYCVGYHDGGSDLRAAAILHHAAHYSVDAATGEAKWEWDH